MGFIVDALSVGVFIGVALAAAIPALTLSLAVPAFILWFLWYSLATIITLVKE